MREIIPVSLGTRSYDIHVGPDLLPRVAELIKPLARGMIAVVTDENVAALHLPGLLQSLREAGLSVGALVVPAGEASKSFAELARVCDGLLDLELDRSSLVIALGGGVIGDLAGFAAGILKRGIAVVQVPTTLLAQVDSSVGGKTGINTRHGKNLVGLFHQPRLVIADISSLQSLPARQMRAGYAEIVKYGALGDARFFAWLEQHGSEALAGDRAALSHAVAQSCRMKAAIVGRDERESGERALLNLGHTFGHALEAACGFSDRLLHGEAVAIGMVLAFRLSERLALAPAGSADRLARHLAAVGLPTQLSALAPIRTDAEELVRLMSHDKKVSAGALTFVLARGIGEAFTTQSVPHAELLAVLSTD
ncbi:MAG: 3-dehydroquinate synthase [Alphaproteobacteria bacterium]|nr:3-dehydroquinate synthase [Alphaproteobacteria bacterium]